MDTTANTIAIKTALVETPANSSSNDSFEWVQSQSLKFRT